MSRNRSKYVHDEHCLSLTHDGDCDCPRPRTLRRPDSSPHGSTDWGSGYTWTERLAAEMERPSGSTGVQPSAEAIEAAAKKINRFGWPYRENSEAAAKVMLPAAYAIDAPAIAREAHAAGVAEGRAAMLREVVEFLRRGYGAGECECNLCGMADTIEARFS